MHLLVHPVSSLRAASDAGAHYRPDIDGLRAIAVLAVIAFHAGLPFAEGGFVGVDIFFVISGYLISGILMKEIGRGTFTYRNFYERRARRILPALFATLIATAIVSAFLLIPSGLESFGKSMAAAILSASNFYFWTEAFYFGVGAAQMPLLHTWSLAIEEQFYLLLPPYLVLARRTFGPRWLTFLVPVAIVSFIACVIGTERAPGAAFYFPFTRAWELGIGGIVAALPRSVAISRKLPRALLSLTGALMLLASIFLIDERMAFPGALAAVPSLGTAALIYAGGSAADHGGTIVQRALTWRPLVFIGLLSYSLYLWHWPILVLSRTVLLGPPEGPQIALLLFAIFGAGYLSWRFIETPFRHPKFGRSSAKFFSGCAAIAALLVTFGVVFFMTEGAPSRFSGTVRAAALAPADINPHRADCDKTSPKRIQSGDVCKLGKEGEEPRVALFGDSFADALSPALEEAARDRGGSVAVYTRSGCRPLWTERSSTEPPDECSVFVDATLSALTENPRIQTVVVFMSWTTMFTGWRYSVNVQKLDFLTDRHTRSPSAQDSLRVIEGSLARMFDRLSGKQIVVVAHWPEQKIFVPQTIAARNALYLSPPRGVTQTELELREKELRTLFARLAETREFRLIDLSAETCSDGHCAVIRDGYSLYVDYNHISRTAAVALSPVFAPFF